jgi:hypothetical protein
VRRQTESLEYAHSSFFTNEPAEGLAERLMSIVPAGFGAGRVAFVSSGSEAVEAALKLARQHFVEKGESARSRLIARRMSYHGNTLGALAVGGHIQRRAIYNPMLVSASLVSPCYAYRFQQAGEDDDAYGSRLADELAAEIERLDPRTVAAFVIEPVVGATLGAVPPVKEYMHRIREVCNQYGVLLICDEVMCGMGRCGDFFVSSQEAVVPDLITIAKGLGAGYQPIGAVLASESVIAPIAAGSGLLEHGQTYMSHPVACAAALAVVDTLISGNLLDRVRELGPLLERQLRERFSDHPHVGDIRGRGLLWGIELVSDRPTRCPFDRGLALARRIRATAQELGLLCYPASGTADGHNGDHVLLAPPFVVHEREIDEIVDILARAIDTELNRNRYGSEGSPISV